MKKRSALFVAVCVLTIVSVAPADSPSGQSARPLSDYFPAETVFYTDCPSVPAFVEGAKGTGLYALWHDESMAAIRAYVDGLSVKPPAPDSPASAFVTVRDFASTLPGPLAVGLYPEAEHVEWLAVAKVASEENARAFLGKVNAPGPGEAAPEEIELCGVKATVAGGSRVHSAVVDGLLFAGSRNAFAGALGRRSAKTNEGSLSASVSFAKASAFLSTGPRAYRAFIDLPSLIETLRRKIPQDAPMRLDDFLSATGMGDIVTLSLEGAFQFSGVVEHVYASTKSAESRLIDLVGREPLDESRMSAVPRTSVVAAGRAVNVKVAYAAVMDVMKAARPLTGIDPEAILSSFEQKTRISVEGDIIPALGKTSLTYYDMPEGATLESFAAGSGIEHAALIEVKDEDKIKEILSRLYDLAENDPSFMAQLAPPQWPTPKLEKSTLGSLTIYYLTTPGGPMLTPAVAVANGFLIYSNSKESVKSVIDRLIAPGSGVTESADYTRVRGALARSGSQLLYVNLDRVIDFAYDNLLKMATRELDAANANGRIPISSQNIPPAYVVKKYVDGVGVSVSAAGNLVDMTIYSPTGGALLVPATVAVPALYVQAKRSAATRATVAAPVDSSAGSEARAPDAARDRLAAIGAKLQLSTIARQGKFPDRLEDVIPAEMLKAPQAAAAGGGSDYIYVPGLTMNSPGRSVLVYERAGLQSDGRRVLFVDGSVEFLSESDLEKLVGTAAGK